VPLFFRTKFTTKYDMDGATLVSKHIQCVQGAMFPAIKWPGHEADHLPPFSADVKTGGVIPPLSNSVHDVVLN
jgi:hypothetical protein